MALVLYQVSHWMGFMVISSIIIFEGVSQGGLVALVCINNMFLPFLK